MGPEQSCVEQGMPFCGRFGNSGVNQRLSAIQGMCCWRKRSALLLCPADTFPLCMEYIKIHYARKRIYKSTYKALWFGFMTTMEGNIGSTTSSQDYLCLFSSYCIKVVAQTVA